MKSWIRKVVLEEEEEGLQKKYEVKPSLAEEAAAAAKAAAAAAADVARTSQEILISKTEGRVLVMATYWSTVSIYICFILYFISFTCELICNDHDLTCSRSCQRRDALKSLSV